VARGGADLSAVAAGDLAAPASDATVRLERLEYGKLCTTPDGPTVEGSEARALARTAGFPAWLSRLCTPTQLGLSDSELDLPAAQFSHGTVLRPMRANGKIQTVAFRMRQRPEDGDEGIARRYWLGRYVFAPLGNLDPLTALEALAPPLVGLVRSDGELDAEELGSPQAGALEVGDRKIVLQTIVYLMSGIPVGVAPPIADAAFFRLAGAIYSRLPAPLRPLFSAGWGVTASLGSQLAFSCSDGFSGETAVFDPKSGTFRAPGTGRAGGLSTFAPTDLEPGRMYVHVAFARDALNKIDLNKAGDALERVLLWPATTIGGGEKPLVSFSKDGVGAAFRENGLHCLDHARFELVSRWLAGTGADDESDLCLSVDEYHSTAYRDALIKLAVEALGEGGGRGRAERLLWISLRAEDSRRVRAILASSQGEAAARSRLLAAAELGEDDVLDALANIAGLDVEDALPREARALLERQLDATLESSNVSAPRASELAAGHTRLLMSGSPPLVYVEWAKRRVEGLSIRLAGGNAAARGGALAALTRLTGDETPALVERVLSGDAPGLGDGERLAGAPHLLAWAVERLVRRWRSPLAADRDAVVPWLAVCPGLLPEDPLSLLARGEAAAFEAHGEELARLVGEGRLPAVLAPVLAAEVLKEWPRRLHVLQLNLQVAKGIQSLMPAAVQWLLFGPMRGAPPRLGLAPITPQIEAAARAIRPPEPRIDNMLAFRAAQGVPLDLSEVAPYVWDWSANEPSEIGASGGICAACRGLRQGKLPDQRLTPSVVEVVSQIARHGATREELRTMRNALWNRIEDISPVGQSQLHLTLSIYPREDLIPEPRHVAALVPQPDWLAPSVRAPEVHPAREERFAVALAGFQSLDYRGLDAARWRDEFQASHVWMVFRNLPSRLEGDLGTAVGAFARRRNDQRLDLAGKWYRNQTRDAGEADIRSTSERLLREILLPLWCSMVDGEVQWRAFCAVIEGANPAAAKKAVKATRVVKVSPGSSDWPVWLDEDTVTVSRAFKELVRSVCDVLGGEALRDAFRYGRPAQRASSGGGLNR
jgi:hypothetical protein